MSKFNELLAELNQQSEATLAKALPQDSQDDKDIQAAAEEGDSGAGEGAGEGEGDEEGEGEGEGEGSLSKSLHLENGEEVVDATEMLKSLQASSEEQGEVLAKALPLISGMIQKQSETIDQLGTLVKSLQGQIREISGQGRGRKTVVTMADKPAAGENTLAKSEPAGLTPQEFMLKANTAFDKKVISGLELRSIDVCLRQGEVPSAELIQRIAAIS